jgi:hypothetical protein
LKPDWKRFGFFCLVDELNAGGKDGWSKDQPFLMAGIAPPISELNLID